MPTIATAGHVDHGKSTLIKALTGQDPDRLAEEQIRGLTIDLGFAWMNLESGEKLAFIDVPGHQKFIGTMLAGAGSVSAVLFVVSVREKMMPQSWEHLNIMQLLGVRYGVVAVTKTAGMEKAELDAAVAEIKESLAGSFLEDAEIVRVDAVAGDGLDEIREALNRLAEKLPPPENLNSPRLWVDRAFTISGSGTVVTGTLTLGEIFVGDELELISSSSYLSTRAVEKTKKVRVRGIQSLGKTQKTTGPDTRTALNLTGVSKAETGRGDVLVQSQKWLRTKTFDASLKVLDSVHKISRRGSYMVYLYSGDFPARLAVLGSNSIQPGESGFVRISIERELPLKPGDRYILRDLGRRQTAGGGEILDLAPVMPISKARPDKSPKRILEERDGWLETRELELLSGVLDETHSSSQSDILRIGKWSILESKFKAVMDELTQKLNSSGSTGLDMTNLDERERAILKENREVTFLGNRAHLGEAPDVGGHPFIKLLDENLFSPPDPRGEISREELNDLVQHKLIINAGGIFFSAGAIESAKVLLSELFAEKELVAEKEETGATVSEIRKKLNTSRKYVLSLLAYFDETGITKRQGDLRLRGSRFNSSS